MSSNPAPSAVAAADTAGSDGGSGGADMLSPEVGLPADRHTVNADAQADSARIVVVLDPAALELARMAATAEAGSAAHVGDFHTAVAEDDVAITATFAARQAGYLGWHWSVTLAVLAADHPTVSEVVLLPGEGALLAPAWIPWEERIRPGDLGIGDLLPPTVDDPRVVPAYVQSDDPAVEAVAAELGLGRVRVLSRDGRVDFADRLHDGPFGPSGEVALAAPGQCVTCAFYLPLAGSLGQLIGACGNEYSPADGRIVDAGFGCGAHSETVIDMPARFATGNAVIDELSLEVFRRPVATQVGDVQPTAEALDTDVAEALDTAVVEALDTAVAEALDTAVVEALDTAVAEALDTAVVEAPAPDGPDVLPDSDLAFPDGLDADSMDPDLIGAELAEQELIEAASLDEGA